MRMMYGAPPMRGSCSMCRGTGRIPTEKVIDFCRCDIGRMKRAADVAEKDAEIERLRHEVEGLKSARDNAIKKRDAERAEIERLRAEVVRLTAERGELNENVVRFMEDGASAEEAAKLRAVADAARGFCNGEHSLHRVIAALADLDTEAGA